MFDKLKLKIITATLSPYQMGTVALDVIQLSAEDKT